MRIIFVAAAAFAMSGAAFAQSGYKAAPAPLDAMISAPLTPHLIVSPPAAGPARAIVAQPYGVRTIAELAEPELRLAGFRFNPETWARGREPWTVTYYRSLALQDLAGGAPRPVTGLPAKGRITSAVWSPDGAYIAVTVAGFEDGRGHGLWIVDGKTGQAKALPGISVNSVLEQPCDWLSSSQALVCRTLPADRGPPPSAGAESIAPSVEASEGKPAPGRTYQDLLRGPADERLLDYHMTMQLAVVGLDGGVRTIGAPGVFDHVAPSPDGAWLLVSERVKPYSYQFPLSKFPQKVVVRNLADGRVAEIAANPLEDKVPIAFDAVGPGAREFGWRSDAPATLVWAKAADGGDPANKTAVRDELFTASAPFAQPPVRLAGLKDRYVSVSWGAKGALVEERWRATRLRRLSAMGSDGALKTLYEGSSEDRYGDPGAPVMVQNAAGALVMAQAKDGAVWLSGPGGTPTGDRPFVARLDLATGARKEVWRSSASLYEEAQDVFEDGRLLVRREGQTTPPNYFVVPPKGGQGRAVTKFPNPFGATPLAQSRLLHYTRADGVPLTATLYLPPNYKPADGPLPTILHAYPAEFKSKDAAGQVKGSPNRFPDYGFYQLYPLMAQRGYAVLFNTALPIIGEGSAEPNDTFVEQLVAGAKAAIDEGVRQGVVDRERVGVTGHSYGAFMTANLMAHSDLFKAGVALSGAYNRTLTPFGFQNETRTYWQAPELYYNISPFSFANRIKRPLSLIHGAADDNQGTFPIQTDRFYAALKGAGVTTRLTIFPYEAHRYDAAETLNHLVWEWDDWFGRYLKGGPAK